MRIRLLLAALAVSLGAPATAELAPGAKAPIFKAEGAKAGQPYTVDLKAALKKGPVVLYFFPAAFTGGCNIEAAAFAQALPDFTKAGATVIGMTAGNTNQLKAFSSEHCAGKFAVAAAAPDVVRGYDVGMPDTPGRPAGLTNRSSFVIAPDGRILFAYSDRNPADHIRLTLEAVRKYRQSHRH
jgi:thioredoxin-dependent peroxiredoxin